MLNRRVSAKLMCASMVVVFFIALTDLIPVAMGCPVPPMPLRALYNTSVRIVVAQVGDSQMIGTEGDYQIVKTALHVSSTVKGKDDQAVIFWKHMESKEDPLVLRDYSSGDTVLMFLTRPENEEGYTVFDSEYEIRRLGDTALQVYLQRISELAKIMEGGKPDPSDLVEWLVRCAEEPATRWEGAYELYVSASMLFDSEQVADDPDDSKEPGEGQPEISAAETAREVEVDEEQNLVSAFAALLTESQKKRLADAFMAEERIEENDPNLMSLVSYWSDPRLVPYLVSQLRRDVDGLPCYAEQMMDIVAGALGDKRLTRLAEKFVKLPNDYAMSADDEQLTETETEAAYDAVVARQKAVLVEFLARVEKKMKR